MSRTDRQPGLGSVLEQAARAARHAAFEYADASCAPDLATAAVDSWRLIHLLGALSDLTTALAAYTGDCPQRYGLRSADNADPAGHLAHASRSWAELRHALDDAQHACRAAYSALSHLDAQPLPGNDIGSVPGRRRE